MEYRHFAAMLLVSFLTACSSTYQSTTPRPLENDTTRPLLSWPEHLAYISNQNNFAAEGKVAIKQNGKRHSAHLQWRQSGDNFDIFITGPLGSGAIKIQGSSSTVIMDISGEGRFYDQSPELLMQQRLGWSLPISNLKYWAKGIPAPGSDFQQALNDQQRLAILKQSNWLIEYQRYHQYSDTDWPRKMQLYYGDEIQVTMLIKQWNTLSNPL